MGSGGSPVGSLTQPPIFTHFTGQVSPVAKAAMVSSPLESVTLLRRGTLPLAVISFPWWEERVTGGPCRAVCLLGLLWHLIPPTSAPPLVAVAESTCYQQVVLSGCFCKGCLTPHFCFSLKISVLILIGLCVREKNIDLSGWMKGQNNYTYTKWHPKIPVSPWRQGA